MEQRERRLTSVPAFCDPTSIPKLPRLIPALHRNLPHAITAARPLTHLSPNVLELDLLYSSLSEAPVETKGVTWEYINSLNLLVDWRAKIEAFTNPTERQWIRTEGVLQKMVACLPFVDSLWVKASYRGLVHLRITPLAPVTTNPHSIYHRLMDPHKGYLVLTHYPAIEIPDDEIISTTGAGDTLVGGLVAGLVNGEEENEYVKKALERAARTMRSRRAVA